MAEPTQFKFTYKELAAMMVREAGVKDGLWGIWINFGIAGSNMGPTNEELRPTALVPILEIGLQRFEQPTNLAVDAREVWAQTAPPSRQERSRSAGARPAGS